MKEILILNNRTEEEYRERTTLELDLGKLIEFFLSRLIAGGRC